MSWKSTEKALSYSRRVYPGAKIWVMHAVFRSGIRFSTIDPDGWDASEGSRSALLPAMRSAQSIRI
eukprot:7046685-Pyramimonas_sp.AAC.1